MAVEPLAQDQRQHSQYIDFWDSVPVPKLICAGSTSSLTG